MSSGHSTPSHFCLLFDCDGTLVDSEILLADVMGEIFPEFGLPFSAQQCMEEFRGVRFHTIVHTLEHRFHKLTEEALTQLEAGMRTRMEARMRAELVAIPGIPDALTQLKSYPKAVVSNGPERKIRCALESTQLEDHFQGQLFSAYTLNVWKPDPELYRKAAAAMGFAPQHCIVIDDAAVGVEAGLAAGMQVIHLNHFPNEESTPEGAVGIHHAHELPAVIAGLMESSR